MTLQKTIAPIPPVIKPMMRAPTAPRIEIMLKIIPRIRLQFLPHRKPIPTASHIRLMDSRPTPMTNPRLPKRPPILGRVETSVGSPIITAPAMKPMTPNTISKIASIVTPVGL